MTHGVREPKMFSRDRWPTIEKTANIRTGQERLAAVGQRNGGLPAIVTIAAFP